MVNEWRQQGKNNRASGKCWRQKPFILCSYSSIDSLRWPFLFFSFFLHVFPTKQPDSRLLKKRPPKYHRLLFIRNILPHLISSYTWLILDNQLSVVYMPENEVDRWYICLETRLLAWAIANKRKMGLTLLEDEAK